MNFMILIINKKYLLVINPLITFISKIRHQFNINITDNFFVSKLRKQKMDNFFVNKLREQK